jgi:CPA1 family monovalent cation:H+ antiporter
MGELSYFTLVIIALFILLTIASYASVLSKKLKFPFTIILFLIGVLLVQFPEDGVFQIFSSIVLSKELVFFIFLPTLIFESAYNMPYKKLVIDAAPITALAIVSLIISTLIIGFLLHFVLLLFGFEVPLAITFLFGSIISATDPISVLSIFKEFGVPKRIMYLFESESLFNDGTAVALFIIILGLIEAGTGVDFASFTLGLATFFSMIVGGIIFGLVMGFVFSKLIEWVNDSWAELTLTLIMAHTTFILAEVISENVTIFKLSAIIATTMASLTLGNYGRYKISKNVRKMMDTTWGYFAFISNSLIFLLMGMLIGEINFYLQNLYIPILAAIAVVIVARLVSVIVVLKPVNKLIKAPISWNWQKLIAWGSLRGAIAITMLLLMTEKLNIPWSLEISPRDFVTVLVIACIVFTLIIKTLTIKSMIRKMGLADLSREEEFTFHQIKEIIDHSIIAKLESLKSKKFVMQAAVDNLIERYQQDDVNELEQLKKCNLKKGEFRNLLKRYSLGIERRTILEAYESGQADETTLKRILAKIEEQYIRIELGLSQLKDESEKESFSYRLVEKINNYFIFGRNRLKKLKVQYIFYRSRGLIAESVLDQLKEFRQEFYCSKCYDECFVEIIQQYEEWLAGANEKKKGIENELGEDILQEGIKLLNNHFVYLEEKLIDKLYNKHIMNGKIKRMLKNSIWEEKN